MLTIIVVYQIPDNDPEYPVLLTKSESQIEFWINEGSLNLGSVYDKLPGNETYLDQPRSVTVIKGGH